MRKRPLGKTGLVVSELALGTWGLSGDGYGAVEEAEAERVIARALDIGITLFETCDAYGGGRMEALLGKMLAKTHEPAALAATAKGLVAGVPTAGAATDEAIAAAAGVNMHNAPVVVTRIGVDRSTEPAHKRFDKAFLEARVEASRRRLRRDRLPIVLLHNPSPDAIAVGEGVDALKAMVERGWIAHWGVSAGDIDVAKLAIDKGASVLEMTYNLFNGRDVHSIAGDLMVSRVGLLARSVLSHGLLAGMWAKDKEFPQGDHRNDRWTRLELERRVEQLSAVRYLVHGDVHSMRAAATRFALANPHVSSIVLGPRSEEQLKELVRETGSGPRYLPDSDMTELPRSLQRVGITL